MNKVHQITFQDALRSGDKEIIRAFPKTDFHNHAICGMRRSFIEKRSNCSIPAPEGKFSTLDEMTQYVRDLIVPHISTPEGIKYAFESAVQSAIDDGVRILEMSVETLVLSLYPDPPYGMISFLKKLRERFLDQIDFRPELGISRDHEYEKIEDIVYKCIESGAFFSVDLYGNETVKQPEIYQSIYRTANNANMKLKAHVGEFGTAESVRHTVDVLDLDEVQHGIAAADSPEIMRFLAENEIQLNLCPTSNVMLSRVSGMNAHPAKILFDNGIKITINTDDLAVFDQSVSDEYLNLFNAGVFSADELETIRKISATDEHGAG